MVDPDAVTLVLNAAGLVLLEGRPVPVWELGRRAAALLSSHPPQARTVTLRLDREQPFERAVELLRLLRESVPDVRVAMVVTD